MADLYKKCEEDTKKFNQFNRWSTRPKQRMQTIEDSQALIDKETRERNSAQSAGKGQSEQWGIRALDLTNQFRKKTENLPYLKWNQELHDIAMTHSQNMAHGKVPFGHDGFKERNQAVKTFYCMAFGENVAFNGGQADPVYCAVDGWIHSPGHRKNLLGRFNCCGIAVYFYYGKFYFTQLLALG